MSESAVRLSGVQKNYAALRPLRIQSLEIGARERVALGGLDAAAAEVLVNLVTGAALPDEGTVTVFGHATSDIADGDAWLASLDRFGIVSPRAVLLEGSTLLQNLALPFTLDIDPVPAETRARVEGIATECGIPLDHLPRQAGELPHHVRVRAHLARALALDPALVLVEHPTADVDDAAKHALARDLARVIDGRGTAALIVTLDVEFAGVAAHRSLQLQPATGALVPWTKKRGWFR
jgi:ABC-type lipoprotein export system ATPase subunit